MWSINSKNTPAGLWCLMTTSFIPRAHPPFSFFSGDDAPVIMVMIPDRSSF
jgi:hypothetical protein